jgi:hypothetical protein
MCRVHRESVRGSRSLGRVVLAIQLFYFLVKTNP